MENFIGRVYKYIQRNWHYLSPNTKIFEPSSLFHSLLQVATSKNIASPDNIIQTKILSSHNCTTMLYSSENIVDDSLYV